MTYNNEGHLYRGTCINVQQIKLLYQVSLENTKFEKIAEYFVILVLFPWSWYPAYLTNM